MAQLYGYSSIEKLREYRRGWAARQLANDPEGTRSKAREIHRRNIRANPKLSDDEIIAVACDHFEFRPVDGALVSKATGELAGTLFDGYLRVRFVGLGRRYYMSHRIIWLMMNGPIPSGRVIDHINRIRDDNRLRNLRLVSKRENSHNRKLSARNSSGFCGVHPSVTPGRWCARIVVDQRTQHLGTFDTAIDAARAWDAKAIELRGPITTTNQSLGLIP